MGGDKQITIMVLKVDLQCSKCYKKIKRVLCKFPQIQDQVYDEKSNTVTIKVVCCSPDCIKKKIISKAGESLKGIEIKVPEKPKPPAPAEKPKEPEKPKVAEKPKEPEKPKDPPPKPKAEPEKPKDPPPKPKDPSPPAKPAEKPKDPAPAPAPKPAAPVPVPVVAGFPPPPMGAHPYRFCCPECNEGRPGGPCFYGCVPAGPPPCYQYDGYYGRPVYDSYGGGRGYNYQVINRCDGNYFSEENPGACSIM